MNVYRVEFSSEKGEDEAWILQAGSPATAISRAIRRTKHARATRLSAYCDLVARNTTYKEWKEKNKNG